jgi:hypothetical protein
MARSLTIVFLAVALGLAGCDSAPRRLQVTGVVNFKGEPLKEGTITFIPLTTSTQEGAAIVEGKFSLTNDHGLAPGVYRVSISSIDSPKKLDAKKSPGPTGGIAAKERIPSEYNVKSKEEIEVTEHGPNRFTITIP